MGVTTFEDLQKQRLSSEEPPPPLPETAEAALGATEMRHGTTSAPQLVPDDTWGLQSLAHFEKTLSPELKQGKEEVAHLLHTSCLSKHEPDKFLKTLEQRAARAISGGDKDALVGMTVALSNVEPIKPRGGECAYLPDSVLVTRILSVRYPSIMMEVKDTVTGNMHAMRIRMFHSNRAHSPEYEEKLLASTQQWADSEEAIARQASCGCPAHLVASQKGLAVPLYVGNIADIPKAFVLDGFYFFSRVQIFEDLHGEFNFSSLITAGLSLNAKEYIAHRLLQIVLKLQQALLSHNNLEWENISARPDGSFLLSGFDACVPFGTAVGEQIRLSGKTLEPTLRIQENVYAEKAVPSSTSDLWSLGMLLYELFTGGRLPYTDNETAYTEDPLAMARHLIGVEAGPEQLVAILNDANCPVRWKLLIMRLLYPVRGARITARGILTDFPDLVGHRLPR
ncbi:hypothetical protein EBH_0034050 [Eimeria brunetti]|uniref:Protein kinase domain-containing protein n=1 Tax=Eimeria brunetti TaxID=51314 RepID=U6LRS0_9EIME|nr:hypothetical protein EBH_0034050 [Eimeria brunetti]